MAGPLWRRVIRKLALWGLVTLAGAPLAAGLLGVVSPAFGLLPALGLVTPGFEAWTRLFDTPGLGRSTALSVGVGVSATAIAFVAAQAALAVSFSRGRSNRWESLAALSLAAPHVSLAFAVAFLVAPSGLIARLVSPIFGWDLPPGYPFPQDPWGLSLIAGLALKELPFLYVVSAVAARAAAPQTRLAVAASLGYKPLRAWTLTVLPAIYAQVRLPVFIALAYAVSSVDQALVLGPTAPPTLSVRLLQWFSSPDLTQRLTLAAGALWLCAGALAAFAVWRGLERFFGWRSRRLAALGARGRISEPALRLLALSAHGLLALAPLALGVLCLGAFAQDWRFPDLWPEGFGVDAALRAWSSAGGAITATVWLSVVVACLAVSLALMGLEASAERPVWRARLRILMFAPLLIPEAALLFGLNTAWSALRWDGAWPTVVQAHLLYALPYAWLMIEGAHDGLDPRLSAAARTLGASRWAAFWRVRAPVLLGPACAAGALAVVVSSALYLPTVFAGAGRTPTLVTESLALASGGDLRLIGALSLVQIILPLAALALARVIPAALFAGRAGMRGGA
ncbi:MAG: ABC transporter permease [Maricaulaceae bacterium]